MLKCLFSVGWLALCCGCTYQVVNIGAPEAAEFGDANIETKRVGAAGLDSEGVSLISPSDAQFDARAEVLAVPGWADLIKHSKPWVVIVANNTQRKIVALTTVWTLTGSNGRNLFSAVQFKAPDAAGSPAVDFGDLSEDGIPSGGQRLLGIDFAIPAKEPTYEWVISSTRDWIQNLKKEYSAVASVHIGLGAVIFEDGTIIGSDPDNTLSNHFAAAIKAKQDLYRTIVGRLDQGETVDHVFTAAVPPAQPPAGIRGEFDMYANEARADVTALRTKYGDQQIGGVLKNAILTEPFVIHRKAP